MKKIALRMIAVIFILTCISGFISGHVLAKETPGGSMFGRIVYIDRGLGFVVFNLGKKDGVREDCYFSVYSQDTKIAEIRSVRVRRRFTAAEVELTYQHRMIKVGDSVRATRESAAIIRHEARKRLLEKLEELFLEAETYFAEGQYAKAKEKITEALKLDPENKEGIDMLEQVNKAILSEKLEWLASGAEGYLDQMKYELAEEIVWGILSLDPENKIGLDMQRDIQRAKHLIMSLQPEIIVVDISAPKRIIHSSALEMLNKYGFMITYSDPQTFNLEASKFITLSSVRGATTEWGSTTRNKVFYTVQIKDAPASELLINRLEVSIKGVYDSEGRVRHYIIEKDSGALKEARDIALAIKTVSESL